MTLNMRTYNNHTCRYATKIDNQRALFDNV